MIPGAGGTAAGAGAAAGAAATGISIGAIIKGIAIAIAILLGAALGAAVIGAVLVFTGDPQACNDYEIESSRAAAREMRTRWDGFKREARAGRAEITFNEEEITSRGDEYIEEKDLPVENLQVYLCPSGFAEATGTVTTPGRKINVLVRGTLDLSGTDPEIDIRDIKAGNLPAAIGTRIVETALGGDWKTLDISVRLRDVDITEGEVTLTSGR